MSENTTSSLFTEQLDEDGEITHLILQWLHEKGYDQALQSLESESAQKFNPLTVKLGSQLQYIYNDFKELQSAQFSQLSLEDEDSDLNELGDGKYCGTLEKTFDQLHSSNILCLRFHPDSSSNLIVTGSTDKTIKVTNYQTKEVVYTFLGASLAPFISLDFNPIDSELLLASSIDGSHSLLRVGIDGKGEVLQKFNVHKKYVVRIRWSPDGTKFATCSYDKTVSLFGKDEANEGQFKLIHSWDFTNSVESLIFTPDSNQIITAVRESNYLYYLNTSDEFTTEKFNMNSNGDDHVSFSAMEFSITPNSKYLMVSTDRNRLILFKLGTDKQVRNFYGAFNDQYCTTRNIIDPSGKYLYSTSQDNFIYIWDISTQKLVTKLKAHTSSIRDLHFSPDGTTLASCGFDKNVCFWNKLNNSDE
eukprot:gene1094-1385_t